jgi:hypothetical protein
MKPYFAVRIRQDLSPTKQHPPARKKAGNSSHVPAFHRIDNGYAGLQEGTYTKSLAQTSGSFLPGVENESKAAWNEEAGMEYLQQFQTETTQGGTSKRQSGVSTVEMRSKLCSLVMNAASLPSAAATAGAKAHNKKKVSFALRKGKDALRNIENVVETKLSEEDSIRQTISFFVTMMNDAAKSHRSNSKDPSAYMLQQQHDVPSNEMKTTSENAVHHPQGPATQAGRDESKERTRKRYGAHDILTSPQRPKKTRQISEKSSLSRLETIKNAPETLALESDSNQASFQSTRRQPTVNPNLHRGPNENGRVCSPPPNCSEAVPANRMLTSPSNGYYLPENLYYDNPYNTGYKQAGSVSPPPRPDMKQNISPYGLHQGMPAAAMTSVKGANYNSSGQHGLQLNCELDENVADMIYVSQMFNEICESLEGVLPFSLVYFFTYLPRLSPYHRTHWAIRSFVETILHEMHCTLAYRPSLPKANQISRLIKEYSMSLPRTRSTISKT